MDALQAGDSLVDIHAGDESGHALGVAGATAGEGDLNDGVAVNVDVDHAGADTAGLVGEVVHSAYPFKSGYGYISSSIDIQTLSSVSIKRTGIDKLLLVGDVYLASKSGNMVLFDIPKSEFIYGKIREMCETKSKSKNGVEFYKEHNECLHCGSFFPAEDAKCPNCGAPIKNKKKK